MKPEVTRADPGAAGGSGLAVIVPTLGRPEELCGLLRNLAQQSCRPTDVWVVDGADEADRRTAEAVAAMVETSPFPLHHICSRRGTAVQRNTGLERARGDFLALIDDDVRLAPRFFEVILEAFDADQERQIGGIAGYKENLHFRAEDRRRWRWYRGLRLLSTFEPGRYDQQTGYPVNVNLQPPFTGLRSVDFLTTACTVWRREVVDSGLRFDDFFRDYGVLEDAHFSLRAGRIWRLCQCGDARCEERGAAGGRVSRRRLGLKHVVNYYFVFDDLFGPLSLRQRFRFWIFQAFEIVRLSGMALVRRDSELWQEVAGRLQGIEIVLRQALRRRPLRTYEEPGQAP